MVEQLARKLAAINEKGLAIIAVQTADVEQDALTEFTEERKIPFR